MNTIYFDYPDDLKDFDRYLCKLLDCTCGGKKFKSTYTVFAYIRTHGYSIHIECERNKCIELHKIMQTLPVSNLRLCDWVNEEGSILVLIFDLNWRILNPTNRTKNRIHKYAFEGDTK